VSVVGGEHHWVAVKGCGETGVCVHWNTDGLHVSSLNQPLLPLNTHKHKCVLVCLWGSNVDVCVLCEVYLSRWATGLFSELCVWWMWSTVLRFGVCVLLGWPVWTLRLWTRTGKLSLYRLLEKHLQDSDPNTPFRIRPL